MNENWILTDEDNVQYVRKATELTEFGDVYELYQVQEITDPTRGYGIRKYMIAHDFVFPSMVNIEEVLEAYGYGSLAEMQNQLLNLYGEDYTRIIAEYQFELDAGCFENLMNRVPAMTYEQAKNTILKLVGKYQQEENL